MKADRLPRAINGMRFDSTSPVSPGVSGQIALGEVRSGSILPVGPPDRFRAYLGVLGSVWGRVGRLRGAFVATAIGVAFGIMLVGQWQSQTTAEATTETSRHRFTQETIDRLEVEQAQLKKQIVDLRASTASEQKRLSQSEAAVASLESTLAEQRAIAGTVPLQGPGIEIILDDSLQRVILPSDDPNNYIIHEYQLRDVANLLWRSGASGISINGERFVNSTSIYCVGSTILINDTRTSPPFKVVAVGDVDQMQKAINSGTSLRDLKDRAQAYGLVFRINRTGTYTIPAFDGSIDLKHVSLAGMGEEP